MTADISITMNKEVINRVSVTKFLGVMIDDKLTWKHHIDLVKSKFPGAVLLCTEPVS